MEQPVIRRTESQLAGPGSELFRRAWLPAAADRVVVLVHGYAEHSGRYEHVGATLAASRCAVHGFDLRGHGRSSGPRCHVGRFDEFLDDLDALVAQVRAEHPGLPLFVVGHSMGGLITAAWARERRPAVRGLATSGAALALSDAVSPGRLRVARLLGRLAPRLSMASTVDPEGLSRDPAVVKAYLEDPLVHTRMTLSLAAELLSAVERTADGAAEVELPMLLLHGEADPLCPAEGSRAFYRGLRGPGCALHVYPELRHEIFNEPERGRVLSDLLDWLDARDAQHAGAAGQPRVERAS